MRAVQMLRGKQSGGQYCTWSPTFLRPNIELIYIYMSTLYFPPSMTRYLMVMGTQLPPFADCAVCEPGYGRGVADGCHACTAGFQGGMYFLVAVVLLLAIVVAVLLAFFLVRLLTENISCCDSIRHAYSDFAIEYTLQTKSSTRVDWSRDAYNMTRAVPRQLNRPARCPQPKLLLVISSQLGGKDAVSSKMSSTKKSVLNLQRRGSTLLARSESRKPRSGFGGFDESSSVGGTDGTATTASWPSAESQAVMRNNTSGGSGEVAAREGSSKNEAPGGRIGVLLSAIPLSKLKIVIGMRVRERKQREEEQEEGRGRFFLSYVNTALAFAEVQERQLVSH